MERVIIHSDANSFYASVECLYHPEIRDKPVAVCGDPEQRHGIVLTANRIAKATGIKVGMAVWQARQCCAGLVVVSPHYDLYMHFSEQLRSIYEEYSDRVESFGLDECWVDLSDKGRTIKDGERLANEIRSRVREELGITVSVGVSFCKVFAKLGSDMKKPDATTVISKERFREITWSLPASDLLFVGPRTTKKLMDMNVRTIGDLANFDTDCLSYKLGKCGLILQAYALGLDTSPVMPVGVEAAVKSVGNSTTPPHDICCFDDAKCIFFLLAESVASRLRAGGFKSSNVCIGIRDTDLFCITRQTMLQKPTCYSDDIAQAALKLFTANCRNKYPFRSVGIHCSKLTPFGTPQQLDFLDDPIKIAKREKLTQALDGIWQRFGNKAVRRGVILMDRAYAADDPQAEHTIHPVPFYAG